MNAYSPDDDDFDDDHAWDDRDGATVAECPECGTEVDPDAELCPSCGHWFLDEDRKQMWKNARGDTEAGALLRGFPIFQIVAVLLIIVLLWTLF